MLDSLKKLKDTPLRNLSTVIRYSGFQLLRPETVDAHTMDMNIIALKILDVLGDKDIDRKDLIYRIVIHDLEESCSCDVPRSLKYWSDEVHLAIEKATKGMVRVHVSNKLFNDMCYSKDLECLEGRIVKFLDIFQCNLILDREVNGYGNIPLTDLLIEAKTFLNKAIVKDDLFKNDPPYIRDYFLGIIKELNSYYRSIKKANLVINNEKVIMDKVEVLINEKLLSLQAYRNNGEVL